MDHPGVSTSWPAPPPVASEERLRAALEASRTGTFRWDIPSGVVWWDESLVHLMGLPGGSRMVAFAEFEALIHQDDRSRVSGAAARCARDGADFAEEFRMLRPDGEVRCFRGMGRTIRGHDGAPAYMTGAAADISEQWHDRRALEEREKLFHTLADAIPQLVWMAKADGTIDWFNRRWYEYTGCVPEDAIAKAWARVHPEHLERVSKGLAAAFAAGISWEDTFPIRGADGGYRRFLTRALPVRDGDGRVTRWFGTNTDVTADWEAGRERERLLAREHEARDAAERAARARDEMIAVVAHDLRTPLHALGMSVGVLVETHHGDGHSSVVLKTMRRLLDGMERLLNDLLDTSRMDAGTFAIAQDTIDPATLIQTLLDLYEGAAHEAGLRLACSAAPDLPTVVGDADRLLQVLSNLIGNAIKFSRAPGTVSVGIARAGTSVQFRVTDCGPGIPVPYAERVFDRFWKHDPAKRRGAGLGLAIAKGIVEAHGGRIWIEPGRDGCTFAFTIPAAA